MKLLFDTNLWISFMIGKRLSLAYEETLWEALLMAGER